MHYMLYQFASLLIPFVPETLSKFDVSANDEFYQWGRVAFCCTLGPKGGGDCRTGTVGYIS